jgi:hypothetical protein
MLKRILIELNLFKINSNDRNVQSQIRYQRITTRLYIGLVALSLVILTLCLALTPQIYVKTIENPTPAEFSHFHTLYPSSLQCGCSSISIPYNVFLTIEPHYHQMCSSDLVSPDWLEYLTLSLYGAHYSGDHMDYGRNAGSQFRLLKKLCTEAKQTITNSREQFLNQIFITTQVVSEETFEKQATAFIEEWKAFTINSFLSTLRLIRDTQFGNHLAASGSDSYFDVNVRSNTFILNSSMYYGRCNCMLSPSCHSPMEVYEFWQGTPTPKFEIPGFFMGCFRIEALLSSNLECFYNQTCMDMVNTMIIQHYRGNFIALNATDNLANESIDSVVRKLFVDKWSKNISYKNYFTVCAPQSCTYEYTGRRKLIFLLTSVISIYGGLSTGLQIVLFIILWLMMKVRYSIIAFILLRTPVQGQVVLSMIQIGS